MKHDTMGSITPQTDARAEFAGHWPRTCEAPGDCAGRVSVRVRMPMITGDPSRPPDRTLPMYLCLMCAGLPEYRVGPRDRDILIIREETP